MIGAATAPAPEPDDDRMDNYRAPVPATLHGGTVLSTEQAHALWERHDAVFVDVLPRPPAARLAGIDDLAIEAT
jgi:hypothetical protein